MITTIMGVILFFVGLWMIFMKAEKGGMKLQIWRGKMQDAYARHVEKRIKELHERMAKSKLHTAKKFKY